MSDYISVPYLPIETSRSFESCVATYRVISRRIAPVKMYECPCSFRGRRLGLARITLYPFVSVDLLCVRPVISFYLPGHPKPCRTIISRLKCLKVEFASATLDHPESRDITVGGRQVHYIPNSLFFLHEDQCKSLEIIDVMQCRMSTASSSKHINQEDQ